MLNQSLVHTLNEKSVPDRRGMTLPVSDVPQTPLPKSWLREENGLPEVSELEVARHYLALAARNFGVESGFYPLGSCTMKYNPKVCERVASRSEFGMSHPLQDIRSVQGNLRLMFELERWLCEIGGFDAASLQPAAGAHGELSALLMIRAWHKSRSDADRTRILIPDSAHGTNPASTTMAGFVAVEVPSDEDGNIDLRALHAMSGGDTAGLMLTNPNTLGLFEQQVEEVIECVHEAGGVVYGDGANMNALTGILRPGDLGIDIMHYNLHKTFGTPHGGGGPGSGPLAAKEAFAPFLPGPVVVAATDPGDERTETYTFATPEQSIGQVSAHHGNFAMLVRAYTYLLLHGADGLRENAEHAVLNANYLRTLVRGDYEVPFDRACMHEFVCEGKVDGTTIRALDISKRLIDFGFHPPTNYFPLIVSEALMIEPTEVETKPTLDAFANALLAIKDEARRTPDTLTTAPHSTVTGRLDETWAARKLILSDKRCGT